MKSLSHYISIGVFFSNKLYSYGSKFSFFFLLLTDSSDDGLLPDRTIENKNIFEEKTEAYVIPPISETNSINSDLHDHDVIDSVMYIYFGGASHGQREAGRQVKKFL